MQELADADKVRAGRQHSFTFLQAGEQLWQPAFLTSIDHQPSMHPPTPKLGSSSTAGAARPPPPQQQPQPQLQEQPKQRLTTLEEDTPTPFSEVCPADRPRRRKFTVDLELQLDVLQIGQNLALTRHRNLKCPRQPWLM